MRYSISGAVLALLSIGAGLAQATPAENVANYVRTYEKNTQRRSEIPSRFSGRSENTQTCTEANTRVRKSWLVDLILHYIPDLADASKGLP